MSTSTNVAKVLALLGPAIAVQAFAEVYMTDEKAVQVIYPGRQLERKTVKLTDPEIESVEKISGDKVRTKEPVIWISKNKDVVFIDQVLGKHEFITYAVGIDHEGKVRGVEILEYRESYGHQIKREDWRHQFVDKTKSSSLKLDDDIKNISGATLSSSHITAGVKRLLQTYDLLKNRI